MVVFDRPPFEDWTWSLIRVGRVLDQIPPTLVPVVTNTPCGAAQVKALGPQIPRGFSPEPDIYERLDHQAMFHDWMAKRFPSWVPRLLERVDGPCIAKAHRSQGGSGVRLLERARDRIRPDDLLLEAIPGLDEYVWHAAIWHGRVLAEVTFRVRLTEKFEIRRGPREGVLVDPPVDLSPITRELDYTGFACGNYKMLDGVPKIFEINPRMGGSLVHSERHLRRLLSVVCDVLR